MRRVGKGDLEFTSLQNVCSFELVHLLNQALATEKHSAETGSNEIGLPLIILGVKLAMGDSVTRQSLDSPSWGF